MCRLWFGQAGGRQRASTPNPLPSCAALAPGQRPAVLITPRACPSQLVQLVKWLVIQTSNLTDKSVIGEWSGESVATLVAVALTL